MPNSPDGPDADDPHGRLETARWHTTRYDTLRAATASRASFIMGAAVGLVAGVALLAPTGKADALAGGRATVAVIAVGGALTLASAISSLLAATGALLASRPWRELYGDDPPRSHFYQHSDTLAAFPSYGQFADAFRTQSVEDELVHAVTNLWVVTQAHALRYRYLRSAVLSLKIGAVALALSVTYLLGAGVLAS